MRRISKAGAERGYAVASVLLALVVIALGAQVATIPTQSALTRNAEAELIFRGQAYAAAIRSYRNAIEDDPRLPQNLEELLDDRRFIGRRHIRRLYDDPMTGGAWNVLRDEDGGIRGVGRQLQRHVLHPRDRGGNQTSRQTLYFALAVRSTESI